MLAPELAERVLRAVDDGFDEQLRVTMDLVRCPSARGAETTAQDLMARELAARGYAVERWRLDPEELRAARGFSPVDGVDYANALAVVGTLRAGLAGGRSLIVNCHVDVVPAVTSSGTSTPHPAAAPARARPHSIARPGLTTRPPRSG